MDIYLVGGAVRDEILNRRITDRDWVVVGSSINEMLKKGYIQVGKSFPVFLHPDTKEEYALARKEKKIAPGYGGFEFDTDMNVSLEQDLLRRDLTINAMAKDYDNNIIDPYDGQKDLQARVLRHVSTAFSEDPLRVLRVARFYAQLAEHNFTIADTTKELLQTISSSGELEHLSSERLYQEFKLGLSAPRPDLFIKCLNDAGAIDRILSEISSTKAYAYLQVAAAEKCDFIEVFAILLSYLPEDELVKQWCNTLAVPKEISTFAKLFRTNLINIKDVDFSKTNQILELLSHLDIWRRHNRFVILMHTYKVFYKNDDAVINKINHLLKVSKNLKNFKLDLTGIDSIAGRDISSEVFKQRAGFIAKLLSE